MEMVKAMVFQEALFDIARALFPADGKAADAKPISSIQDAHRMAALANGF